MQPTAIRAKILFSGLGMTLIAMFTLLVGSSADSSNFQQKTPAQYPVPASGNWKKEISAYPKILAEVRPYFGKDGFINVPEVRKKLVYHVNGYKRNAGDPIYLMRAMAWMEVALSDGNVFDDPACRAAKNSLRSTLFAWGKSIDSFAFIRTYAIIHYLMTSPDTFTENRLLEKLYAYNQRDSDLELIYLVWCLSNNVSVPNRLTLKRILEKQEKLEFRHGPRLRALSMCYFFFSTVDGKHPDDLETSIRLTNEYYRLLPIGHANRTPNFKESLEESNRINQETADRWRRGS